MTYDYVAHPPIRGVARGGSGGSTAMTTESRRLPTPGCTAHREELRLA